MTLKLETDSDWWPVAAGKSLDDFYTEVPDDNTFHIGQSYSKQAAPTIACKLCGGPGVQCWERRVLHGDPLREVRMGGFDP